MSRRQEVDGIDTGSRRSWRTRFEDEYEEIDPIEGNGFGWEGDGDLDEATMEDLRELADELEIEDYEMLSRDELRREIRKETRAEP